MNSCRDFESLLSHYVNAELEAAQAGQLEKHLSTCPDCRREVALYQKLSRHMAQLPPPAIPETAFVDFRAGVADRVARGATLRMRLIALPAVIAAFYSRRRMVVLVCTAILIFAGAFAAHYFGQVTESARPTLAAMLQNRDWLGLYYEMSSPPNRAALLREPVPAGLLLAVLRELVENTGRDPRLRAGLEQVLARMPLVKQKAIAGHQGINRVGVIASDGVQIFKRIKPLSESVVPVVRNLSQIHPHQKITLNELISELR